MLKSIALAGTLAVACMELFSGCVKPHAAPEDALAARAFRYGCALSWQETAGTETKNQFTMRMCEQALSRSTNDCTTPIWLEAIRQQSESR